MEKLVSDLATLINFPTVSRDPVDAIAAHLAERLEAVGFDTRMSWTDRTSGKCNVVARKGPELPGGLCLSGHMDVVPTEGQPWTSDPFTLTERDGSLYGRGTADMKGFIAAATRAVESFGSREFRRPLWIVWTHDEEIGCQGSAALVDRGEMGGMLPEACLIGEPTGFQILRQHAGHVAVGVDVTGRAAHTSKPHLGINAIDAAAEVIRATAGVRDALARSGRPVPMSVARIHGGEAVNVVPDHCHLDIGFRPLPGMDARAIFDQLRDAIDRIDIAHAGITCTIEGIAPSLLTEEGTALQHALMAHADTPETGTAPFATDGGNLARLGMRPLVFGPGSIDVAHRADEYITVEALGRAEQIVHRLVHDMCIRGDAR